MEDNEVKPARAVRQKRGTSFPVLPLPEAAKVIEEAGKYGKQHSISSMATYAGHTTINSGAFKQKMAAFRDWGLITGTGDTCILTERAVTVAHPPSPEEKAKALMAAFQAIEIFWKVYEDTTKGQEVGRTALANSAVSNHGIAVASKERFVESLVESAVMVGLAEKVSADHVRFVPSTPLDEKKAPPQGQGNDKSTSNSNVILPETPERPTVSTVLKQVWPTTEGEIVLEVRSNRPLEATAFGQVGRVVEEVQSLAALLTNAQA